MEKLEKRDYFVRFIQYRASEKKRVLTVAIVSDRVDRYNTIIEPEGCMTDFSNVMIDYNHNNYDCGCKLINRRIESIDLDNGDRVKALVGDIEIYETSMLRNEKGEEIKSVFEALDKKQIKAVSVRFRPVDNETYENKNTKIRRYRKWELPSLALLDVPSGQGDAVILDIRALLKKDHELKTNNRTMEKEETKKEETRAKIAPKEDDMKKEAPKEAPKEDKYMMLEKRITALEKTVKERLEKNYNDLKEKYERLLNAPKEETNLKADDAARDLESKGEDAKAKKESSFRKLRNQILSN